MAGLPATLAQDRSAEMGRATRALLRLRIFFVPIGMGTTLWYWRATGSSPLRLALIGGFFALVIGNMVYLFRRQRRGIQSQTLGIVGAFIGVVLSALTGGLGSPFVIVLPVTTITTAVGSPRRGEAWVAAGMQVGALPLLAAIGGERPLFTAGTLLVANLITLRVGLVMRDMFERTLARMAKAHDDILRMHSEQMQSLTALSSEIARELRAPLRVIVEQSGLRAQELREPRTAAGRLEVLRTETGRMQNLLEEFLNFSRPLSPLSLDTVDGAGIGAEIVDLFQGVAQERRLSLVLCGDGARLRCDRRKIKQVLINLVQNAVDASAPGGEIDIEVRSSPSEAAICVLDRGHGLAADVEQRLFQPGVTTKPHAPGLGLTIARSIAEQHGGRLTLHRREGGGCAAELMLPLPGTPAPAEGRAA